MSSQEAEFTALLKHVKLWKGCLVTFIQIASTLGIAYIGPSWRRHNFVTSLGKPIKHADLVEQLFPELYLPKAIAVLKVKAHTSQDMWQMQQLKRPPWEMLALM